MRLARTIGPFGRTASFISAIVSAAILLLPKITIATSVNLDPKDAFATQFAIKNEGHVPVWWASFRCNVDATGVVTLKNVSILTSQSVSLWPGQTITRNCAVSAHGVDAKATVVAAIDYYWVIPIFPLSRQVRFSGRHGEAGYFLVPDLE